MPQSSTLDVGLDGHPESSAGAEVAHAHGAEVVSCGTSGPRPGDLAQLLRPLPSKGQPLVCVYAAGPCGSWLARDLTPTGDVGGVVAPSLMPPKPGDRVHTDCRDARPWARLMRAGDLTPGSVPAVDAEASRALRRARDRSPPGSAGGHVAAQRLLAAARSPLYRASPGAPGPPALAQCGGLAHPGAATGLAAHPTRLNTQAQPVTGPARPYGASSARSR